MRGDIYVISNCSMVQGASLALNYSPITFSSKTRFQYIKVNIQHIFIRNKMEGSGGGGGHASIKILLEYCI